MNNKYDNSLLNDKCKDEVRAGCIDIWNAFMTEGAHFGKYDIPFCPNTSNEIPKDMITWDEARKLQRKYLSRKEFDYFENAYINWYIDDYRFDSSRGIWHDYKYALNVIKHFAGVITPDFSTYQDFPYPIKIQAVYKMRTFGYWLGKQGIKVINNVRWGTSETYDYCFEGIPTDSIVSIGTVGGGPRKLMDRERFEKGLYKMVEVLNPHTILVYGSANGECFDELRKRGIKIVFYQSATARAYERRKHHE